MTALRTLAWVEIKLLLRDFGALLFPMILPLFILVIFGISFDVTDGALPATSVAIALALNALYTVPNALGSYREQGILRRLSTTPMHPGTMLAAQLLLQLLATTAAVVLVLVTAIGALGIAPPRHIPGAILAFALGTTAMFALGCLVAAITPNSRSASGLGVLLYFPLAFLGGVTVPRAQMPPLLAVIGDWTPLGAFRQSIQDSWAGVPPQPLLVGIMLVYAVVLGVAAAKLFRWE